MEWIAYLLYGFISGLGQVLLVSTSAHDFFLELMTNFDPAHPLLQLCVHLATLGALCVIFRHRIAHIYRETRIDALPERRRRRQPDVVAVLDGRVALTIAIVSAVALLFSKVLYRHFAQLPIVVVLLLLSGIVIYVPHFLQSGNRESRHLSRLEAGILGLCAALSVLPGVSRMGMLLSAGALRGCGRSYLLDIGCLMLIPVLVGMVLLDLLALAFGAPGITLLLVVYCLLAALTAYCGTCLAVSVMRFLAVNRGYTMFSYFNWGLAVFGFLPYLMI